MRGEASGNRARIICLVEQKPGLSKATIQRLLGLPENYTSAALHELYEMRHVKRRPSRITGDFLYFGASHNVDSAPAEDKPLAVEHPPVVGRFACEETNLAPAPVSLAADIDKVIDEAVAKRIAPVASDLLALRQLLDGVIARLAG